MRRFALGLAVLAAAAGSGCAADTRPVPAPRAEAGDPVRYACNDGAFLSVRFEGDVADVTLVDGRRAQLARRSAASGARYASDAFEFWSKGDAAGWTENGSPATTCLAT